MLFLLFVTLLLLTVVVTALVKHMFKINIVLLLLNNTKILKFLKRYTKVTVKRCFQIRYLVGVFNPNRGKL